MNDLPLLQQQTLVLVAMDQQGYARLNRLLSRAHREGKHAASLPLETLLESHVDGLFAIQPMRGRIRTRQDFDPHAELKQLFDGRYYLAVSRHLHPAEERGGERPRRPLQRLREGLAWSRGVLSASLRCRRLLLALRQFGEIDLVDQ